jgi:hypothetical protein
VVGPQLAKALPTAAATLRHRLGEET